MYQPKKERDSNVLKAYPPRKSLQLEAAKMGIKGLQLQKEEKATALVKQYCFISAPVSSYGHDH